MRRFGPFAADVATRALTKHGVRVRIQEQPFRILEALLERPGNIVTRETLKERLWAADTFVDFERSLNAAVAKLRQCLNDSAEAPVYVETVAGQGYRFIAPVSMEPDTPAGRPGRRRWWMTTTAAAAVAVAAVLLVGRTWRADSDRPLAHLDLDVGDDVGQPAISPDGLRVAFVTKAGLAVRRLDQARIQHLAATEGATFPFFSPDGRYVAYFANRKLAKIAVDGGVPATLCDAPYGGGGSWAADGSIVAALDTRSGLARVPAAGGASQPLTDPKREGVSSHRLPQVLPGGKAVLFVAGDGRAIGSLQVARLDGSPSKVIAPGASGGRVLPGGYLVYHAQGSLLVTRFDLDRLEASGAPLFLVEGVGMNHFLGADFDVSASGTLVYRRGSPPDGKRDLVWLDASGRKSSLDVGTGAYLTVRLSPDGNRAAFTKRLNGEINLWVHDLARHLTTRVTSGSGPKCCPVWTRDGKSLFFSLDGALAWMRSDGAGAAGQLGPASNSVPWSVSADGEWLTFHRNSVDTATDAWMSRIESTGGQTARLGEPRSLIRQPGVQTAPVLSPDGRWVAYHSDESGRMELYVAPVKPDGSLGTGRWPVTGEGATGGARWSRVGQEIFYRGLDRRIWAVPYKTEADAMFVSGAARQWAQQRLADVGVYPNFDVAPDGKRMLAIVEAAEPRPDETHLRLMLNVEDELRRRFRGQ